MGHILKMKEMFKEHGFKVKFVKKVQYRTFAYGSINDHTKEVHVSLFKRDGSKMTIADKLFVLAHEYRHLIHIKNGLYKAYYTNIVKFTNKSVIVGHKAELDCDRWARKYLKSNGFVSTLSNRHYPLTKVRGYMYIANIKYGIVRALNAEIHGKNVER